MGERGGGEGAPNCLFLLAEVHQMLSQCRSEDFCLPFGARVCSERLVPRFPTAVPPLTLAPRCPAMPSIPNRSSTLEGPYRIGSRSSSGLSPGPIQATTIERRDRRIDPASRGKSSLDDFGLMDGTVRCPVSPAPLPHVRRGVSVV